MANIFTSDSPDMQLENAFKYNIPVDTDLISAILEFGMFDHVVTGPGLTADIIGIKDKGASDGRIYIILLPEPEKLVQWYEKANHAERVPSTFRDIFVCEDASYAVAVVNPKDYGLHTLEARDVRLTNKDCLLQFLEANLVDGINADGTYLYRPKELAIEGELKIINEHAVMNKFDQIYIKCYQRLGFDIAYNTYVHAWKWICAKQHRYTDINDVIKLRDWINGLADEPLTSIT
jgi:hypothetical protein